MNFNENDYEPNDNFLKYFKSHHFDEIKLF